MEVPEAIAAVVGNRLGRVGLVGVIVSHRDLWGLAAELGGEVQGPGDVLPVQKLNWKDPGVGVGHHFPARAGVGVAQVQDLVDRVAVAVGPVSRPD